MTKAFLQVSEYGELRIGDGNDQTGLIRKLIRTFSRDIEGKEAGQAYIAINSPFGGPESAARELTLKANGRIGLITLSDANASVTLEVVPKLPQIALRTLLHWSLHPPDKTPPQSMAFPEAESSADTNGRDWVPALLTRFLENRLLPFLQTQLRRDYEMRCETLCGRIRGRVNIGKYVCQSIARAKDESMPLSFFDFTGNTIANKIIRWTLRRLRMASRLFYDSRQQSHLIGLIDRAEPYLWNVDPEPVRSGDFARIRYFGHFAKYQPIHAWCRVLLDLCGWNASSDKAGVGCVMIDAWKIFEDALRNCMRKRGIAQGLLINRGKETINYRLAEMDGNISQFPNKSHAVGILEPDIIISDLGSDISMPWCIVDAKYKAAFQHGESSKELGENPDAMLSLGQLQVPPSDIYQMVSYGSYYARLNPKAQRPVLCLAYPSTADAISCIHAPYIVSGFESDILIYPVYCGDASSKGSFVDSVDRLLCCLRSARLAQS